jgi:hypothetical protein
MGLTWLLDNRCFDENLPELKNELTRQGIKYITGEYKPFGQPIDWDGQFDHIRDIDDNYDNNYYFAYGSLQFVKRLRSCNPFLQTWCNLEQFACNYYYPRLSNFLFNQDHAFLPYGELIDKEEWVFDTFGVDDCVFMRPSSGFKEFTGQVYEKRYWKGMIEVSNTQIQPEDLVVVARPQYIAAEFRVIVGPNGPITSSQTHVNGGLYAVPTTLSMERDLFEYVREILDNVIYEPDPMFVIDIALDDENIFSVIEVNSASCSGFYKCDLSKIVGAIKEYFNFCTRKTADYQ